MFLPTFSIPAIAISAILTATSTAAPTTEWTANTVRPYGDAWADVTQCAYFVSNQINVNTWQTYSLIGTIMNYTTYDGWSATMYSNLVEVNSTAQQPGATWPDASTAHCTNVYGYNYCFQGSFQGSPAPSHPPLSVWGPNTPNNHVQFPSQPSAQVEAKDNSYQDLCLNKWPVTSIAQYLPAGQIPSGHASGEGMCTTDFLGRPYPSCPLWYSTTNSYYNMPYTL